MAFSPEKMAFGPEMILMGIAFWEHFAPSSNVKPTRRSKRWFQSNRFGFSHSVGTLAGTFFIQRTKCLTVLPNDMN
jgi:hypothetical protein